MPDSSRSITALLKKAGFPDFPLDEDGFPQPGKVIRFFRERMTYLDSITGEKKHWTQVDLATRLNVSEVTVRLMETQNKTLDSISRRRLLTEILKIPPVLLGLSSFTELEAFLKQHPGYTAEKISSPAILKGASINNETLALYQDAFLFYSGLHFSGTARDSIYEMEQWINRAQQDLEHANKQQQQSLRKVIWDFHTFVANVYSDSLSKWDMAFSHLNAAMDLANLLGSDDLRAASLLRSGQIRLSQRNFFLAKNDLDGAVRYVKNGKPYLKCAIYTTAGLANALVATDATGQKYAQNLVDEGGKYVINKNDPDDTHAIKYTAGKYLTEKADMLITLHRPGKALEVLDDAETNTERSQKRRLAYIDILRAESYMSLKKPRYDTASSLLLNALDVSSAIKSEYSVGYINRLYGDLRKSPYGKSTDVADLGLALRNCHKNLAITENSL